MLSSKNRHVVGLIILIGSIVSIGLSWTGYQLMLEHQNRLASQRLSSAQQSIAQILYQKLALTTSLEAFVDAHHYLDLQDAAERRQYQQQFELFTRSILDNVSGILSLQIAPRAVVSFVTQQQRNQKAIGHDLLKDAKRRPQIVDLIQRRGRQISGPLKLIQGGEALIMRKAVFSQQADFSSPYVDNLDTHFWGLVTVLIDYQEFLQEIGVIDDQDYEFAIKGRHGLGHQGDVFWGNAAVFDEFIDSLTINFDGGQWLVAVRARQLPARWPFVMLAAFGLMIFAVLAYLVMRLDRESLKVRRASELVADANKILADKSAMQNKLFAIIGHELRTPAASLKMLFDKQHARQKMIYADSIAIQLEHLLGVIDDMSVVSNPERAIKGSKKITSVKRTLYELIEMQDLLILDDALKISIEADELSAQSCEFNVQLFRQIILNLIKNSQIHSHASRITIQLHSFIDADQLVIKVIFSDNGCGINPAFHDRMFEAFERDAVLNEGTGLGLYVSRKFAREALQGDLIFDRLYQNGSRFILLMKLPLADEKPASTLVLPDMLAERQIVYAEDNQLMRSMTQEQLELAGATVHSFENGQLALTYLNLYQDSIDLLLTDAFMPELNGFDLIRQARQAGFSQTIIALTAASVGDEGVRLIDCGADHVLYKPLDVHDLPMLLGPPCASASASRADSVEPMPEPQTPVFDFDKLMANYNQDINIYRKFVSMFADNTPPLIRDMRAGLGRADFAAIHHAAHQLKGNASTLYAESLTGHMLQLMSLVEEQQTDELALAIDKAEQLSQQLQQALQRHLEGDLKAL